MLQKIMYKGMQLIDHEFDVVDQSWVGMKNKKKH